MTKRARASRIGVAYPTPILEALVDADIETLITALYVKIDDELAGRGWVGTPAALSRFRAGLPGGGAGAAGLHLRGAVAALCP